MFYNIFAVGMATVAILAFGLVLLQRRYNQDQHNTAHPA